MSKIGLLTLATERQICKLGILWWKYVHKARKREKAIHEHEVAGQ